ncbi:unnamed protein product [Adineta ricciae]|uniref:ADP ribosyltransferase domain-containing protein n=1 Tax=Adineta ricciae TaxID=249248 RepID=A0A815LAU1_ADIRI|nr:unnamed protein product [Adineta ricciae]CAF1488019.1 unnamed protein product [Adineta ricciae]
MIVLLGYLLHFLFIKLFPSRASSHTVRRIEDADLLWLKSLPCSDNVRLIWCDPNLQRENDIRECLKEIDRNALFITDVSLCQTVVQQIHRNECKSIFLILSGSLAEELLPHVTSDVYTIFIFCFDQTPYLHLIDRPKIDMISDSSSMLIERIKQCLTAVEQRYSMEHRQESLRNLSKEGAAFIWFHCLRNVVRRFDKSDSAKEDMMKRFREYFKDNSKQLQRLTEFSLNYEADHCLWWYTQPAFISDVLNKTLRAFDIEALFDLRYCIADLCQLLEEQPRLTRPLLVYRAVLMAREKFEELTMTVNVNDLISMRGFLSTSSKLDVAERFGLNDANDPKKVEVLYKIEVPIGLNHIVCADIGRYSQFSQEEEILFDLDSAFEFIGIIQDSTKIDRWIIQLRATDRGADLANKYIADSNRELGLSSADILFGKLLIDMGNADKAIDYFQSMLNSSSGEQTDVSTIQSRTKRSIAMNHIGHAWFYRGDYQRALHWFDSALDVQQQDPKLISQIANTINNKGVLYMMNAEHTLAFDAFEQAVDIYSQSDNYEGLATTFGNMGTIKDQMGEYEEALQLYRRVDEAMRLAHIHDRHPMVAENKMKIAFVYVNQAQWQDALNILNEVKDIRQTILPPSHVDMGRTWFIIGIVLRNQNRYQEAFEHFQRALAIYTNSYTSEHRYIADVYNSMANLKSVQDQFNEALPLYEQAKEHFRKCHGTDEHHDIARVLNNMGQAHRHLGNLSEAINYLEEALHMRKKTLGIEHPDTATTWVNLGLAHKANNDLKTALACAQQGLIIRRNRL